MCKPPAVEDISIRLLFPVSRTFQCLFVYTQRYIQRHNARYVNLRSVYTFLRLSLSEWLNVAQISENKTNRK